MDDGTAPPDDLVQPYRSLCLRYLEPLRLAFGAVTVTSGWRSATHNERVGGAPRSRHLGRPRGLGVAADVYCRNGSPRAWYAALDELRPGGLGLYVTHVHVDSREVRARW